VTHQRAVQIILLCVIVLGIYFRLDHIADNQLFYYDEGHYLTIHRTFDEVLSANPPKSFGEFLTVMKYNLYLSLKTGKGLWFFLSHLRSFWGQFGMFYFPKLLASFFGIISIGVVYVFAQRYFESHKVASLAAALLAIMPSHVYYSRLGLQETLSALCLLLGFYFYLFPRKFNFRSIVAALFFALAYFSNYRMFIIPGLVGFVEAYRLVFLKESFEIRKFIWCMVTFASIVIALGLLNEAGHLNIIFFWMLRQAATAKGHFHWMNLLSYPYAVFKLEGIIFGLLFFGNCYFILKRKWKPLLPFALSLFFMLIFSFAHEKGTRYMVVAMPFMAMAVAYCVSTLLDRRSNKIVHGVCLGVVFLMFSMQIVNANQIRSFRSDYLTSIDDLKETKIDLKILTTQPFVQNLYLHERDAAVEMPHKFRPIIGFFLNGYQYMIIGPQAYVSYTKSGHRFDPQLEEHLEFIVHNIEPIKEYEHFSPAMLERFVLEHNVNLKKSLEFLRLSKNNEYNRLRIYKTVDYVNEVIKRLEMNKARKGGGEGAGGKDDAAFGGI